MSAEELDELSTIDRTVESSMDTFSVGFLITQCFLAFGLKHLWAIMNLL